jgi:hypothetical protein
MLNFYLLNDNDSQPVDGKELEHVGRMEYYHFQRLQQLNLLDECLDFYNDFRISSKQVEHKYQMFLRIEEAQEEAKKGPATSEAIFLGILSKARDKGKGLLALSA